MEQKSYSEIFQRLNELRQQLKSRQEEEDDDKSVSSLEDLNETQESLDDDVSVMDAEDEVEELRQKIKELDNKLQEEEMKNETMKKEMEKKETDKLFLKDDVANLQFNFDQTRNDLEESKKENGRLKDLLTAKGQVISNMEEKMKVLTRQVELKQQSIKEADSLINILCEEKEALEKKQDETKEVVEKLKEVIVAMNKILIQ